MADEAEIIDLRSIVPWDVQTVITSVCKTGRLLIVQEDTENCSVGQMIVTTIASMEKVWRCLIAPPRLLSKPNVMIGFSEIYENAALPTSEKVVKAIFDLHVIKCLPLDHMSNKTRDVVPMDSLDNISPIILPFFGEGIDRASVLELYKKPGDKIQIGDVVAEMETDKAVFSVAAQEAGVLNHWKVVIGQKLQAGAILGEVVMENTQKTLKATPVKQGYSKTLLAKMRDVVLANAQIVFEWTAVRQAIESLNKNRGSAIATPTSIVAWCTAKTMLNHSAFRLQATDGTDAPAKTGLGIAVECKNGELGLAVIANTTDITIDEFLESYANNVNATRNGRIDATATPLHISSLIHHGIRAATPLVAPPALATLFVGEVFLESKYSDPPSKNEREVVLLSLSFDQRFIAGLQAVSFLGELRNNLENCNFP